MLSTRQVEQYLQYMRPEQRDIVMELRSLIYSVAPAVTEIIDRHGFTYFYRERGDPVSAGLCRISTEPDHVRLAFMHGAFLPDPLGLLHGDRIAKRYATIDCYESAPWDALKALIEASNRFGPRTPSQPEQARGETHE